tara:strand:- start:280 stop:1242 length:963 start_codon:yes stop_codon:yes gene_type:complete
MKVRKTTASEFVIQEKTSLKGNPYDICKLNISMNRYKEIKTCIEVKILIVKTIYDEDTKNFIQVILEYDKESFISLSTSAGKTSQSIRLNINSEQLFEIKRMESIDSDRYIKRSFKNLEEEIPDSVQKRAIEGVKFEKEICIKKGWKKESKSPKLYWEGNGRSWIDKLKFLDFNVERFKVNLNKSKFKKWDAIDELGNKYEIKKYDVAEKRGKYILYSEPIIKIAPDKKDWKKGHKQYDVFPNPEKYNKFINDLMDSVWWKKDSDKILNKIINSSKGIQFKNDIFIKKEDIEFSWKINTGKEGLPPIFKGYHRLSIVFKV